ncbi:adenylate/guanylate cyclase domain-containing protein [Leptolyngbya sp. AN02str]|uniref:adenylate/guanylate cyclase domain-containing protein n=1 Tax=Leptolyngbya sp. AN02str TaxID=3423363 RepID=UPI003D3145E0
MTPVFSTQTTRDALINIEPKLRQLLPAELYARVWVQPQPETLMQVFRHLSTLQRALQDYVPRQVAESLPQAGRMRFSWREGALLFTDLAGFTPLLEANASYGNRGAIALLNVLNRYFSDMLEIVSKSGGELLEFTGDAMLVQFLADGQDGDVIQAVRAGLRMQRAMDRFRHIDTPHGTLSLAMRVGIHAGRYLTGDVGSPKRMAHILLGKTVQQAKQAESLALVGQVCVTQLVGDRLRCQFDLEPSHNGYALVKDNLTADELGEYDIALPRRRTFTPVLFDRSVTGLINEIQSALNHAEVLASYLPRPILNLLIESTASRSIPPEFPEPVIVFVNLMGIPEAIDTAIGDEVEALVSCFSDAFALIDAIAEAQGAILQKVTYHSVGSDMLLYFGALSQRQDDPIRAAEVALAIRQVVYQLTPPVVDGQPITLACRIGIASGAVFSAEIGEPRGRREFNILGDPVNTAARLMTHAQPNEILLAEPIYHAIAPQYDCTAHGPVSLKGKARSLTLFALERRRVAPSQSKS